MKKKLCLLISMFLLLVAVLPLGYVSAAPQTVYYVDPNFGDDDNPGLSPNYAFETITKARDVVRTINGNMTGDIIVYLRGGNYSISDTLIFGTADSGTNGYDIIYKAYGNEVPVVSGGVDISTGWTLHDGAKNIYRKTGVNWNFRQLYSGEERGIRARFPNLTNELTGEPYFNAINSTSYPYTVNTSDIGSWANCGTAEMVIVSHWKHQRLRVSGYSGNSVYFKSPENGFAFNHAPQSNAPFYFENAYDLLDAQGEWFLDSESSTLYYIPRQGQTMNATQIIAPKVETLVSIQGSAADNKVHNIQFSGIVYEHSNWLAPNDYGYIAIQAGYRYQTVAGPSIDDMGGTGRCAATVAMLQFKYSSNITIDHSTFRFAGGWGIMGNEGTDNTLISHNSFIENAGGGIALGVVGNMFDYMESMQGQTKFDKVTDNTIDSVCLDYADMVGIGAMVPQNLTIARNEIKNLAYTGISVGWNWTDSECGMYNVQVYKNKIHDVIKLLDDGGGIYTLGRITNAYFGQNYIYNFSRSSYSGGYPIAGIYMDNGSCYKLADNNVLNNTINAFFGANPPNHDNTFCNNYYNDDFGNTGINTVLNNTSVTGQNWPQAALDIINASGPLEDVGLYNIARGREATASSNGSPLYDASRGNDGLYHANNDLNCWASGLNQDVGSWWKVDLGSIQSIGDVRIEFRGVDDSGMKYFCVPKNITFQFSNDNSNWTTVISKSEKVPSENSSYVENYLYTYNLNADGRYLRLLFEDGTQNTVYKYTELSEVEVYPQVNLAAGKMVYASSIGASDYETYEASKANDSVYHTNYDMNCWASGLNQDVGSWWKVDLGSNQSIGKIKIQFRGRDDNGMKYFCVPQNISLQVSNDNVNWATVISKSTNVPVESSSYSDALYTYNINANGRYLRMLFEDGTQNTIYKIIELSEVEVYQPVNMAAHKAVSASSIGSSEYNAEKGVDGIYSGNDDLNCWASGLNQDVGSWWKVDLGNNQGIGKVKIQFRGRDDNGMKYFCVPKNITFQVSNDNVNWTTVISKSTNVPIENTSYSDALYTYSIDASGRYLRLLFEDGTQNTIYKYVELTEVEVY